MYLAFARFCLDGRSRTWDLAPGAIIGRSPGAALRVHDPEVSEAHALVSLRGRTLQLLRLRGPLSVDGEDLGEVELAPGTAVQLSPTTTLVVDHVELPTTILALEGPEGERQELAADSYSLYVADGLDLVPGLREHAMARIWNDGEGWQVEFAHGRRAVAAGDRWFVGGVEVRVVELPVARAATRSTQGGRSELTLVARHTSCHIQRRRRRTVVVDGQPGRVLSELVAMRAPVGWTTLAADLWPQADPRLDRDRLRRRWDRVLRRLRLKLREAGVREDLVRPDGQGNVELVLLPGDRLIDES